MSGRSSTVISVLCALIVFPDGRLDYILQQTVVWHRRDWSKSLALYDMIVRRQILNGKGNQLRKDVHNHESDALALFKIA